MKNIKTVLTLFNGDFASIPKPGTLGYEALYKYFSDNDIVMCRAPIQAYDSEKRLFKKAQFFIDGQWVRKDNIIPDVIYDKSRYHIDKKLSIVRKLIAEKYVFLNSLVLSEVMSDKALTFQYFKEFSANTIVVSRVEDVVDIKKLKTRTVIIKPLNQSGGKGIYIIERDLAESKIIARGKYPVLVQEFVDSANVDNVFVSGYHDIRIIIRNKVPFYAFVRIPQQGERIANVARGASLRVIPIKELLACSEVKKFIDQIIYKVDGIDSGNKLYAVDFLFDSNNKPWLIELNSRPGLVLEKSEVLYREYFYKNLLTFFANLSK